MDLPQPLLSALHNDRLSDSYLFYGRETSFYRPIVIDFFLRIACNQTPLGEYCDDCNNCIQIRELTHPDLVAPGESTEESEGDAGTRLSVSAVREDVVEPASLTPARSKRKLFWLNNPLRFTPEASNALLKVLEEPPGQATFVITARSRWDCLPTVRSRCQWIRFSPDFDEPASLTERIKKRWPERSISKETIDEWIDLLNGDRSAYEQTWDSESAEQFLGLVLFLIHQIYSDDPEPIPLDDARNRLSYRLVDPILERMSELDRGAHPGTVVNSLLEEIFMPGETKEWVNVI